ncbi:UNVERIFIED_CONTAM: hypothetical protein NY603_39595, partial [Bacteroidetes bacterium 56_B9]
DPSKTEETDSEDDKTTDKGEADGNDGCRVFVLSHTLKDVIDDSARLERHDGDGADRDVFRGGEKGIGEDTDE